MSCPLCNSSRKQSVVRNQEMLADIAKNSRISYDSPDLRIYESETFMHNGKPITMRLCEEFVEGRWEPFYSMVREVA